MRKRYVVIRRLLAESVFRRYFRARRKIANSKDSGRLAGSVDGLRYRIITGWAYDAKQPDQPIFVRCQVNGAEVGVDAADRYRSDVASAGHPTGLAGFEFAVPDDIGRIESVRVLFLESGSEIPHCSQNLVSEKTNRALPPEWKSGSKFRFPSAFIIGAPKCGTTSLYTYLEQHPDFCMSKPKEPIFFEAEFNLGKAYYFNRYFSHWKGEKFVVDARVAHLYLPYIAQRLTDYNPDARLIVVLRNPAERTVSHWWHQYSRGHESLPLKAAIAEDLKRIEAGYRMETASEQELYERTARENRSIFRIILDTGYYYRNLRRYLDLFPRDQLHVILFDDLAQNPRSAVEETLKFLGADPRPAGSFLYPVVHRSDPDVVKHLDKATIAWLIEHYRPHNEKLEQLLGRSLEHWNRPFENLRASTAPGSFQRSFA